MNKNILFEKRTFTEYTIPYEETYLFITADYCQPTRGGYTIMKKALPVFVVLALLASGCKVDVSDTTPPANPSDIKAYGGLCNVRLSWTNPDDSDFYAVEITADAYGEITKTIAIPGKPSAKTSFNFEGLTNGKEYTFVMRSVDTVTNRSSGTTIT